MRSSYVLASMVKPLRAIPIVCIALILGLAACGSGSEADKTVAIVGKTKITSDTLNHWMSTIVGGDYQEIVGTPAPDGLVSEPANYAGCVFAAKRIAPRSPAAPKPNAAQIRIACRQLYTAVKEQALSYLISALWRAEEGAELGERVSDGEVAHQLQEIVYREYKSPAQFRRFLASRHWSVADERYLLKRNLLDTKFLARLEQRKEALGGGERALAKLLRESVAKWSSKTSCSPGYTAWQCRRSSPGVEASPSASQLLEKLGGVSQ